MNNKMKAVGINWETSDRDVGPLTEMAVKQLQSMKYGLVVFDIVPGPHPDAR